MGHSLSKIRKDLIEVTLNEVSNFICGQLEQEITMARKVIARVLEQETEPRLEQHETTSEAARTARPLGQETESRLEQHETTSEVARTSFGTALIAEVEKMALITALITKMYFKIGAGAGLVLCHRLVIRSFWYARTGTFNIYGSVQILADFNGLSNAESLLRQLQELSQQENINLREMGDSSVYSEREPDNVSEREMDLNDEEEQSEVSVRLEEASAYISRSPTLFFAAHRSRSSSNQGPAATAETQRVVGGF